MTLPIQRATTAELEAAKRNMLRYGEKTAPNASKQDAKKAARTAQIQEKQAAKQMSRLLDRQKNRPPPEMPIYGKPPEFSPEERADLKSKIKANKGRETAIPSKKDAEMAATNSLAPKTPPPPVNTPPVSGGNYLDNEIKSGVNAMPNAAMNVGPGVAGLGTAMSNPADFGATAAAGNIAATAGNRFMKKGGSVRNKPSAKFSSGGSTSKASSRGDGIAQRGKTKGRYI